MKTSMRTVPWKSILVISVWLEIFGVDCRPLFSHQSRSPVPILDMLQSSPTLANIDKLSELTKNWVEPDDKNLNKTELLAMLGNDFDSFYMSVDPPKSSRRKNGIGISMRTASIERRNAAISKMPRRIRQLQFEVKRGERKRSRVLGYRASSKLRQWLWELSRCPINYTWADRGLKVFPRYIRDGKCIEKPCSFPSGMKCQPRGRRTLSLLIWFCRPGIMCNWHRFPVIVNESCQCSCKSR